MKSFEIVPYTGKSIVHCLHIAHHNGTARCCLKEARQKISKLPANSALLLTDAAKATYNTETGAAIKEFAAKNTPYVKASTVVGVEA